MIFGPQLLQLQVLPLQVQVLLLQVQAQVQQVQPLQQHQPLNRIS